MPSSHEGQSISGESVRTHFTTAGPLPSANTGGAGQSRPNTTRNRTAGVFTRDNLAVDCLLMQIDCAKKRKTLAFVFRLPFPRWRGKHPAATRQPCVPHPNVRDPACPPSLRSPSSGGGPGVRPRAGDAGADGVAAAAPLGSSGCGRRRSRLCRGPLPARRLRSGSLGHRRAGVRRHLAPQPACGVAADPGRQCFRYQWRARTCSAGRAWASQRAPPARGLTVPAVPQKHVPGRKLRHGAFSTILPLFTAPRRVASCRAASTGGSSRAAGIFSSEA